MVKTHGTSRRWRCW